MKKNAIYIFLFAFLVFFSCKERIANNIDNEDAQNALCWESISESENYNDYIIYLNDSPDTEHFDTAIKRYIEYKAKHFDTAGYPIFDCFRNCIKIEVGKEGIILFENRLLDFKNLRKAILNQLINPSNDRKLPEKIAVVDNNGIEREVSKGVLYVIFRLDYPTSLKEVTIELKEAIEHYKDYLSILWYNKPMQEITKEEKENIESTCKTWYLFDKFDFYDTGNFHNI